MASSSSSPRKHEWLVILPDHEGALEKRMEVRPKHIEAIASKHKAGFYPMGGAFMSEVPKEGETPSVLGSVVIAYAESKEEVLRDLKGDVYTESGVWDWDRVQIYPFKSAIRSAM